MAAPVWEAINTPVSGVGNITPLRTGLGTIASTDILLLFVESADGGAAAPADGGWAAVADSPQLAGGGTLATRTELAIFWVRGDPGSDPVILDTGNHQFGVMARISGCITSGNPWDVTAGDADTTADTAVDIPGDDTTVADCLIVAAASTAFDSVTGQFGSWANASLTSFGQQINIGTEDGNGGGIGVATGVKATAGTVSTTTATLANSSKQGRIMIALKPPAGAGTQNLTGTLFQSTPTFNVGTVTPGSVTLSGSLFQSTPTFFTGTVAATYALAGTLFATAPTFFTGTVTPGAVTLTGSLFQSAPSFFTGTISTDGGTQNLSGSLFTSAPTFFAGTVSTTYGLSGSLFQSTPTFFTGTVSPGAVTLTGSLFQSTPTFQQGTVSSSYDLTGSLFALAPTFFVGAVTSGAVTLTGSLFQSAPSFFVGTLSAAADYTWQEGGLTVGIQTGGLASGHLSGGLTGGTQG